MDVLTRKEWGARSAEEMAPNPLSAASELFVHWLGETSDPITTLSGAKAAMREIQNFHLDSRGWSDFAYSYAIIQARGEIKHPIIAEGRLFKWVPASQLNHNTGTGSILVFSAADDPTIREGTLDAIRRIWRRFPGTKLLGHRDAVATGCPGDELYSKLPVVRRGNTAKRKPFLP